MSDYFLRLAERTLGQAVRVQPLISSRYSLGPEAQSHSNDRAADSAGAAQPPTELSNSVMPGSRERQDSSQQEESHRDGARRRTPAHHALEDGPRKQASLTAGLPSVDFGAELGASLANIHQTAVEPPTRGEKASAKPSSVAIERAGEWPWEMPAETSPAETHRDRIRDTARTDPFPSDSEKRASAAAAQHSVASAEQGRLPEMKSRSSLIPVLPQESAARETVGEVASQPAIRPTFHSEESVYPPPDGQTALFDLDTGPVSVNTHQTRAEPPVIRVTIGRIEVRAAVTTKSPRPTPTQQPAMSLDDYLKRRQGGR